MKSVARVLAACGLLAVAIVLAGCKAPPQSTREAFDRMNNNYAKLAQAVSCKPALVSFSFKDADGATRRFIGQPATLIFQAPRSLYLDIQNSLAGSVARIGSNDERYWLYADVPEVRKMWWGSWAELAAGRARPTYVPPDRLMDALMMRPLPERIAGVGTPIFEKGPTVSKVRYPRVGKGGKAFDAREIQFEGSDHMLPTRIIDRLPDGRVLMDAQLSNYQRVEEAGADAPFTPRKYVIRWEVDEAELRMDLRSVKFRKSGRSFAEFPSEWQGPVESLDRSSAAPRRPQPDAAQPSTPPANGGHVSE